jgi:hypothetical protein
MLGPRSFGVRRNRRLELALGHDAIFFAHHGKTLALAGIRFRTAELAALGAPSLTGVRTNALARPLYPPGTEEALKSLVCACNRRPELPAVRRTGHE